MPLPDCLRLPTPRQPTPEVRSGRAYRDFFAVFIVLLTVAIVLFVLPFVLPPRWHWPLWIAAAGVIVLTAPLRARGIHRGLLSHYAHGTAVEGTVAAAEDAGGGTWRLRHSPAASISECAPMGRLCSPLTSNGGLWYVLFRKFHTWRLACPHPPTRP